MEYHDGTTGYFEFSAKYSDVGHPLDTLTTTGLEQFTPVKVQQTTFPLMASEP